MLIDSIQSFFLQIKDLISSYDWLTDTLDILLVAVLVYGIIVQLRKSQSIQIIKGVILVIVLYVIVNLLEMKTSSYIFSKLFNDIIVIFVIIFSTEIRQALESVGKRKLGRRFSFFSGEEDDKNVEAINAVCRAAGAMSRSKVGSLIVFQRTSLLGDLTKGAVSIDSETTYEMICSIFYPKAPLHDGAVVIKDGRVVAARCVVPMTNAREITENVGTRHRAALEVSLNSDAVVVVTSEETGIISLAVGGQLKRGLTDSELREELGTLLLADQSSRKGRTDKKTKKNKKSELPEAAAEENTAEETAEEQIAENTVSIEDYADAVVDQDFSNILSNEGEENDEQE